MTTKRYDEAARSLLDRLDPDMCGMGVIVTAARQPPLVSDAISAAWPGSRMAAVASVSFLVLPADPEQARAQLVALNESRQRMLAAQHLEILIVSRAQLPLVQQVAGDAYSTAPFVERCPFVPDASVDHDQARRELARWYRQRFGQLDLRGFIRAESEDVAWSVEDVYQALEAEPWSAEVPSRQRHFQPGHRASLTELLDEALSRKQLAPADRAVILGHPGSGKSFFLRWLALHAIEATELFGITAPLPLMVPLAAYARAPRPIDLHEYIIDVLLEAEQPMAHLVARSMAQGQALFLLDGLDEVGNEAERRHVAQAVRELAACAPGCIIVATSRLTGYSEAPLPGPHYSVAPLSERAIEQFLMRWCERYARDLHGPDAAERGRNEGHILARDVMAKPELRALAENPLLLTVLAIVHRAGVRLPDHRVELYSHATQVLVERWNQVRSLSGSGAAVPIKTADAVRLLGPVALEMLRSGMRGAISEASLRRSLDRALEAGHLRTITSADEALQLFQRSLGLLIEQGPGLYAFLHLTLAEYFAARELVRTSELERLASDPRQAFSAEWREVLLLAAGELGVMRADDHRLEQLVESLISAAQRRPGKPSPVVPSVLGGLLADDPGITTASAQAIIDLLIPTWWFERQYGTASLEDVFWEALSISWRILHGRFGERLQARLAAHYEDGVSDAVLTNMRRNASTIFLLSYILHTTGVDNGALFLQLCQSAWNSLNWAVRQEPSKISGITIALSRKIVQAVQDGILSLALVAATPEEKVPCTAQWSEAEGKPGQPYLSVPCISADEIFDIGHRYILIESYRYTKPEE